MYCENSNKKTIGTTYIHKHVVLYKYSVVRIRLNMYILAMFCVNKSTKIAEKTFICRECRAQ